jgi:hypothetical protein
MGKENVEEAEQPPRLTNQTVNLALRTYPTEPGSRPYIQQLSDEKTQHNESR